MKMLSCNQGWPWFALQVKASSEKTVTGALQYKGYECFLPVNKSRRCWSDRIKELELPLFPGYLFCRFDRDNRLPILQTPGVIQVLGIGKTPTPVDDEEIAALQCVGDKGLPAEPWPFFQVGHIVLIEKGPLHGLTGIVVRIKSQTKLVLSVSLLRRSVAVEVPGAWLGDSPSLESGVPMDELGTPDDFSEVHPAQFPYRIPGKPHEANCSK